MDEFKDRVDEKLKSYANSKEKFSESDIAGSLKALTKDIQGETIPISVLADILAFEFSENARWYPSLMCIRWYPSLMCIRERFPIKI